jgi:hypothetical protein
LLATLRAEAAKANIPTQRLIRLLIEAQLAQRTREGEAKGAAQAGASKRSLGKRAA